MFSNVKWHIGSIRLYYCRLCCCRFNLIYSSTYHIGFVRYSWVNDALLYVNFTLLFQFIPTLLLFFHLYFVCFLFVVVNLFLFLLCVFFSSSFSLPFRLRSIHQMEFRQVDNRTHCIYERKNTKIINAFMCFIDKTTRMFFFFSYSFCKRVSVVCICECVFCCSHFSNSFFVFRC